MAADLTFRIGAELTEIKGALAALRKDFATVGQAAQQAGGRDAFQGLEGKLTGAAGALGRLVAGFVTLAGVVKLIGAADEINTLNARLKIATSSTEEFQRAQVALFELSQRTRSSLGETVTLYSRIAQATKDAGVGQETLLQVVETINQAVQLSGASTQAAEAALVQLGQGLASGTLRGEELNSILEQTPALADAIAKGMGITRGELRQYGQDGKISAEQVIKALQKQKDIVAEQFAQLPLTVGQSVTLLKNAGLQLVGAFDGASQATGGLARVIKGLADFLSSDEVIGAIIEFAATWSGAFEQIVGDAQEAVQIIRDATQNITGSGEDLVGILGRAFRELPVNLRTVVKVVTVTFAGMVDSFIADAVLMKEAFAAIFTDDTIEAAIARRNAKVNASLAAVKASIDDALAERQASLDDAADARKQAQATREQARKATGATGLGNFKTAQSDAQKNAAAALRKAQLDAEERLLKDSTQRQLGILGELYEDGRIAAANYYAAREAIELAALDRAIETERQRTIGGSAADRAKALADIEILERQRGDIQRRAQRDRANTSRDLDRQLEQARAQELESKGQAAEAARIRLEAQYRDLLVRLEAEGNAAGARLIRGLIDTGVARAQFADLQAQFDRAMAELERKRREITDRVNLGVITPAQGRQEEAAARQQALEDMQRANAELQALAASTNDPAIIEGANRVAAAIKSIADQGLPAIEQVKVGLRAALADMEASFAQAATSAGVDALTGLFTDLASGTKSAGDALKDFVRGFVSSMAQIAARALATYLVLQLLDAVFPGLGKTVAAGASVSAGVNHSGGMAGTGPRRSLPAWMFAGAPRFHSGGKVGLKPGEVPAVLQEGERVLNRQETAAYNQGAGTRIVNVIDPALVQDYMSSAAGERVILNVIERNAGSVRQKLA